MKTLIPAFLSFVAFGTPAATQQPGGQPAPAVTPATSEAERLFRDAWWAESGKNDLETALRGYLTAAAADGPASVRAKSLLHAAGAQQRLGKADAALDLYRKVLAEYATERASVEQARVHLRELTAVDLRQNYDEWYERRLFGEEIQLLILGKLEALTSLLAQQTGNVNNEHQARQQQIQVLEAEIVAFGKGAVPALQKACSGGHDESREHAIDMLFRLGELPSAAALLSSQDWVSDAQHWARLLVAPSATAVPASTAWHRPLLVAARQGAAALLEAMLALRDPGLFDSTEIFTAITVALLQDAESQAATLLTMAAAATPLLPRKAMESALIYSEDGTFRLTSRQWLDLSEDPLQFELRVLGTRRAANLIGKADEAILESLLHRAETVGWTSSLFTRAITEGLGRLVAPLDVPWTAPRVRRLILLGQRRFEGTLAGTLTPLHMHAPARAMLAEAMLTEPAAFVAAIMGIPETDRHESLLAEQVALPNGNEHDNALFCARWYAAMLSVLERDWTKWDDGNRAAAVWIVQRSLRTEFSGAVMRTFFDGKKAGAAQPVRDAIEALLAALPPG